MNPQRRLSLCLLAIAALYALWFARDKHALAAMLVFVLPALLLAVAAWRGWPRAGFFAGVFALLWFSHGVMTAWAQPDQRMVALVEIALALAIVYASSIEGIRARFGKKR
ncbi:MAG: DUF2069 domain-containing protein [Lysobacteraceae bacterium]|nr:MAG: DUF2069 domain-containing protein [Xanthomonadaceae bacterium]